MLKNEINIFITILSRDLIQYSRRRGEWGLPLVFFVMIASLYPLGLGPNPKMLQEIAPAVIWVAVILAILLSLESLFQNDYQEGFLEQMILSPHPLSLLILAKVTAHWMASSLPLILLTPLMGLIFHQTATSILALVITLLLGTPALSLVGALGASLTLSVQRGGLLLMTLLLPLMMPIIIFGVSAVVKAGEGVNYSAELKIMGAILLLTLSFVPMATAAVMKTVIE